MIQPFLDRYDAENPITITPAYLRHRTIEIQKSEVSFEHALESLKKCQHVADILTEYEVGISSVDRRILVGLLGRLATKDDPEYGKNLLMEIFSRVANFRKDITVENLKLIKNYYPITCSYFGKCQKCKHQNISSPVELISDIIISTNETFNIENISINVFTKLIEAAKKYSTINDEIPLYFQLKKLENLEFTTVRDRISEIFSNNDFVFGEPYEFKRNEGNKIRSLYNVNHLDNIVSTYFLFVLNNFFYTEISPNSYGYQLSPSFGGGNIFRNWFSNWAKFSKKIEHKLFNEEFANYYVVKIDIKSFYDRIDLQRLMVKLYEETPQSIAIKIDMLDESEKAKYKNIVKYLIELSKHTTKDKEKGLPQGPAYARYLAELYLIGLDKLIEDHLIQDISREFYYRFVDDIFIFVETHEKAAHVLKSVESWMGINNLELNYQKTEIENVKRFADKGKFKKFQDDAKYLINKANKNKIIAPESEIREALAKLDQITTDVRFGLKDNLRFFYYQFTNDPRLNHVKRKLNKILPFADSGRGTLFMLFYDDLIRNFPEDFWALVFRQNEISGLSLGHYLNTVLNNHTLSLERNDDIHNLIINIYKRLDLSEAHKSLVLALSMKYDIPFDNNFLKGCSKFTINSIMETPEITINLNTYHLMLHKLEELGKKEFILELFRIIHDNPLSKDVAQLLAKYTFTRFTEWTDDQEITELLSDPKIITCYYHCVCFFTLFDNSDSESQLIKSWEILLTNSEKHQQSTPFSFDWLNRAIEHKSEDFSKSSYSILLSNKFGAKLAVFNCKYDFVGKFRSILLVLLFSKDRNLEFFSKPGEEFIDDSLFGKWLKDSSVSLYPLEDHICLKNLALNGLIVLENKENLFIKNIAGPVDVSKFDYLPISNQPNSQEIELEKSTNVVCIYQPFENFTNLIKSVYTHINSANEFMQKFNTNYPVYYRTPYAKGNHPLIPFYSSFTQRVSAYGVTKMNDVNSFWEDIDFIINQNNHDLSLISDLQNPFNFKLDDLMNRFFPKSEIIIQGNEQRTKFIVVFAELLGPKTINNIYDFQYYWLATIAKMIDDQTGISLGLTALLTIHFENYDIPAKKAYDILFSVNERTSIVDTDLRHYFNTIKQSFVNFQSEIEMEEFSVVELLDEYTTPLMEQLTQKYSFKLEDFAIGLLGFTSLFNTSSAQNEIKVAYEGKDITGYSLLLFDNDTAKFWSKTPAELQAITTGRTFFAKEYESQEEGVINKALLIYQPEYAIEKAFERVQYRQGVFIDAIKTQSPYRNVFPRDEFYKEVEKTYLQFQYQDLEKNLKNHYTATDDIKDRIVSWLTLINNESIKGSRFEAFLDGKTSISQVHTAILSLLSAHCPLTDEDIAYFKENLDQKNHDEYLIFAAKHPDRDKNGLFRLLARCGYPNREPDFEKSERILYSRGCPIKKLVILLDTSITGSQFIKAFNYYTTPLANEEALIAANKLLVQLKDKYFEFKNIVEQQNFLENLKAMEEIIVLMPTTTEQFKKTINDFSHFQSKKVSILSNRVIPVDEYMYSPNRFHQPFKEIINQLTNDVDLLKKIFKITDVGAYSVFAKNEDALNTVLRLGSLPTKHIKLLSLQPINGQRPLLDYIYNWKK